MAQETTRRNAAVIGSLLLLAAGFGCGNEDLETFRIDFGQSAPGWTAGFADYPAGQEDFFELESGDRTLPAPLDSTQNARYISGNNHSDDLWMYLKGRVVGLDANRLYRVRFDLQFATRASSGCVGVGGAPGEDVTVKAGASTEEPEAILEGAYLRMNVDKGQQTNGGESALVVGDVSNTVPCGEPPRWELKHLSSGSDALDVTTDGSGAVWLFVGTDSGFEATTSLYYTWVVATFEPL